MGLPSGCHIGYPAPVTKGGNVQEGRVYKKGTNWMLQYWQPVIENGVQTKKRVAKKLGPVKEFRTKEQAQAQAELILAPINAKTARPESTDTVLSFLEHKYLPYCERELRPSTYHGYLQMFGYIKPHLGDIRLRDFRTSDADRILKTIADQKVRAHTTHRNLKTFLSSGFKYAKRTDLINDNPVRDCRIPRGKSSRDRAAYSVDEISVMLAALGEPARTVVLTAALTGLRKAEVQGLRWEDLNEQADRLAVRRSVWEGHVTETKTLRSAASIPIVPLVKRALEAHSKRTPDGFIFQVSNGSPLRAENLYKRDMKDALKAAGVKWRGWHPFRHGVGSTLHALGTPIKLISEILRHTETKITMDLYVKPVAEEQRAAMAKMEKALSKSMRRARRG
jgi:integrase